MDTLPLPCIQVKMITRLLRKDAEGLKPGQAYMVRSQQVQISSQAFEIDPGRPGCKVAT
jgi:hypothetical protein